MSQADLLWFDLYVEGDAHPRRFDKPESVRAYLSKVERLGEEGISTLLDTGEVAPPITRRRYRLEPPTVPVLPEQRD